MLKLNQKKGFKAWDYSGHPAYGKPTKSSQKEETRIIVEATQALLKKANNSVPMSTYFD